MNKVLTFFKREAVFTVSLAAALMSLLLVPFDLSRMTAGIDVGTLCLLFALMTTVAGFRRCGVFDRLSAALRHRVHSLRALAFLLMSVCFFLSMVITNDVALLTFVPFTLLLMTGASAGEIIWVVTLETMAANLGSMATPIGNPQNLYLYVSCGMSFADFLETLLPFVAVSYAALAAGTLLLPKRALTAPVSAATSAEAAPARVLLPLCCALLIVCLLAVFKVYPAWVAAAVVLAAIVLAQPALLRRVDWTLLATFVCFFVFVSNVKALPAVSEWLQAVLAGREVLVSAACSQIISNVPATLLLAPFAADVRGLMLGVDLGGLGTLVASLASLISFKLYSRSEGAQTGRFLGVFTAANFALLGVLLLMAWGMGRL